jgi:hypothetical protein
MHRLRRKNDCSLGLPVAAEVLESRALLSAGAAAVHAATQHAAALHPATHHSTPTAMLSFKGTVIAGQTPAGGTPNYLGANLSVASFSPQVGAKVSAHFNHVVKFGNAAATITGTFKGKITAVNSLGGGKFEFDVQETGSVTISAGGEKTTAPPDGTPLKLYYNSGLFQELKVNVVFPVSSVDVNYDLTLSH